MCKKSIVIFLCVIFIFSLWACGYNINNVPKGVWMSAYDSPNGKYTINIYLFEGSATVDTAIRGELVDNESGDRQNIYWNYHEDTATVIWIDDATVDINGHQLNVPDDVFDFREH